MLLYQFLEITNMSTRFIGREKELKSLEHFYNLQTASLIVVSGRRRVGKSRLIEEFAKNKKFVRFSGVFPSEGVSAQTQRDEFSRRLASTFDLPPLKSNDWGDLLETLAKNTAKGQVVILLDEISWMSQDDPTFLPKLKTTWDEMFKQNSKLILVLCSSISSWVEKNILSTTGFVGRIAFTLKVNELPLNDSNKFWGKKKICAYEKFKILSITGGIPLYLENLDFSASAETNIHKLCFTKGGLLVREFNNIFSDYFSSKSPVYEKILKILIKAPNNAAFVCKQLKMPQTGLTSEYFDDLEQAGFITRDYTWNIQTSLDSKLSNYRLSDNYTRFYLKYIHPILSKINRETFEFFSLSALQNWETVCGLQFENLVLQNRQLVKNSLEIPYGDVVAENPFYQRPTKKIKGCQVDYMIQTRFNTLFVCEIKFSKNPITQKVIHEVEQKIKRMTVPKNFSIRPVLIHVNGVTQDVVDERFFDKIINFSDYLDS